jgi:hypothetical protein
MILPQSKKRRKPKPRKRTVHLVEIPEPEPNTRSVLVYTGEGTVIIKGTGNVTMLCGRCQSPLAEGVEMYGLQNLVLRCKNCGAYNDTLA